jgi:DNA ligase (NAD+)
MEKTELEIKQRIEIIKKQLVKASDSYYNDAISIMSDEEYDSLYDELSELSPDDLFFSKIGSATKTSEWKKSKHKISMSSLNKVNVEEELINWANTINDELYICEEKLDGISLNLEYENSTLQKGITRGDGFIGENIYSNVIKMKGAQNKIKGNMECSVRGEVVLKRDDFKILTDRAKEANTKIPKNPRNAASGTAKRFDGSNSDLLSVLTYDIEIEDYEFETELEKMEALQKLGYEVSPYIVGTIDEIIKHYRKYQTEIRANTPYDIDGLVVKANSLTLQKKLGLVNEKPKAQIAFKFESLKVQTSILDVIWSNGRNRRITPVAKLKPVDVGGITVSNASLHNVEIFNSFKFNYGDIVEISRRNDVIPQIERIIKKENGERIEYPKHCPICGHETLIEEEEIDGKDSKKSKFLICPNDNCPALTVGNLLRWIGGIKVKFLGEGIINILYKAGKIKEPADFYKLQENDIAGLERLGEKTAKKILKNLNDRKELTLPELLGNLNMYNFSTSRVEMLVNAGYDTLEKIYNISESELVKIKGIEEKTAKFILTGLKAKRQFVDNLLNSGITIKEKEQIKIYSDILLGKSFCFTGAINKLNPKTGKRFVRDEMELLVKENSGTVSSVKKGLTYLVQVDPGSVSSKSGKAVELEIEILSEENFFKMLGI